MPGLAATAGLRLCLSMALLPPGGPLCWTGALCCLMSGRLLSCLQWERGEYAGLGVEAFPDGSLFLGQYAAGSAAGLGVCIFLSGDLYEGQVRS